MEQLNQKGFRCCGKALFCWGKLKRSIPQWLKPPVILRAFFIAGDKSPAYRPNKFFRNLFNY
jgi:hypothetical protein